jgi:N-acetylmuramoyl-L-alanine amidase
MIYLLAGHHIVGGKGTGARTNLYDEAVLAAELRNAIALALIARDVPVWKDRDEISQSAQISALSEKVNRQDIVLDIHFNAAVSPNAGGVEIFVPDDPKPIALDFAHALVKKTVQVMGSVLRRSKHRELPSGVKLHTETQHGDKGLFLMRTLQDKCDVVCLLEVAFLTNPKEMERYMEVRFDLAEDYAILLKTYHERLQKKHSA